MEWTSVLVAGIAAGGSITTAWLSYRTRRDIRLPSGGKLGPAVERVQGLARTSVAHTAAIVNGAFEPPHGLEGEPAPPAGDEPPERG